MTEGRIKPGARVAWASQSGGSAMTLRNLPSMRALAYAVQRAIALNDCGTWIALCRQAYQAARCYEDAEWYAACRVAARIATWADIRAWVVGPGEEARP